jgi:hypothetical protein
MFSQHSHLLTRALLVLSVLSTLGQRIAAQESGDVKITFGFSYAQQPRSATVDSYTDKIPSGLNITPWKPLNFDISSDTYVWKKKSGSAEITGGGDTTFTGAGLLHSGSANSWNPNFSIVYSVKVATSDPAINTNREPQHTVELGLQFVALPIWSRLDMTIKAGPNIAGRVGDGENASAVLELNHKVRIDGRSQSLPRTFLSNTFTYVSKATAAPAVASDSISLIRKLGTRFTFSGGVKLGVTEAAPRFGAFVTIAYQFNYLKLVRGEP